MNQKRNHCCEKNGNPALEESHIKKMNRVYEYLNKPMIH